MALDVAVIDYRKGNLSSVVRSLAEVGANARVAHEAQDISRASALVLPGVGSFHDAMSYMREHGQAEAALEVIAAGKAFLGICLGEHLLLEEGDEGATHFEAGLGIFKGRVERLESRELKVPHVGWNQLEFTEHGRNCPMLAHVKSGANVYFTHSYATGSGLEKDAIAAETNYTRNFASVLWSDNVFGVQFHPEKSSRTGLLMLADFVDFAKGV